MLQQLSCLQAGRFSPLQLQQAVLQARQDLQARRDILACSLRRLDRRCRPDKVRLMTGRAGAAGGGGGDGSEDSGGRLPAQAEHAGIPAAVATSTRSPIIVRKWRV